MTMELILLQAREVKNSRTLGSYLERDGYKALAKALAMDPAEVIDEVKASGVRGRGVRDFRPASSGASFPRTWPSPNT